MPRRVEFGASTFCASCYANEQCGANGLPLTPNSIRILGRFQKLKSVEHPKLCAYIDLVRTKHERVIVVAELYEDTLSQRIKSSSTDRSVPVASHLAYDILSGLAYMNSLGLVHRNLAPSNVLFDHQGSVKLAKYGLYHMTGYGTDVSFPIGLPKYLAPEVLCTPVRKEPFYVDDDGCVSESFQDVSLVSTSSPRTDVWSVGIILLEFLLGQFLWDKLPVRQILTRMLGFLQSDVHPLDVIVRDHHAEGWLETLSTDFVSFLKACLTSSPSDRPLPSELLDYSLFADMKPYKAGGWSSDLQMFSTSVRCLNLELPSCDEAFSDSDDDEADADLLSRRHISEIYYLWKLAGGDLEGSLRKAGLIRQQPPITQLPLLVIDDGESFGEMRDSSSLFDDTVVILSQDQLRQRLKDIDPSAYYPLLENETLAAVGSAAELPHSHSASDLQECTCLPVVIRERDVEYQFHRVMLFERLLKAYPYKRQQILQEARVDIPPLFRAHIWAALLQVEGDIALQYDTIDKESPIATDRQIEVDIPRCHQYNELLSSPVGHAKFKRLLKAWVVSHPEYVYWQGLDSLCAPFLYLNFNNEALAYACLTAFIPKYLHNFFLKDNARIIQEYLSVFSHLIAFHDPHLSAHLDSIGFIPDLYAIPWFLTMYAHVFPLHKIFHLWDMLLLGNSSFPLCIGVAILRQLRDQLLKFGFNECILLFSDMPEIDIEKCVHDSIKIFCSTPKSATFRQYAMIQKDVTPRRVVHSYYTQDYHETPKTELSMEPIPAEELKAEKFPRISAEDLIQLCELSGPSKAPNPAKSSKSSKPLIVVIDVRSEDEYKRGAVPRSVNIPFHSAFNADGSLVPCPAVSVLNQYRNQVKVVVGGSRGNHANQFAESLIRLGYYKVCILHKGIDVLRATRLLTVPMPEL